MILDSISSGRVLWRALRSLEFVADRLRDKGQTKLMEKVEALNEAV